MDLESNREITAKSHRIAEEIKAVLESKNGQDLELLAVEDKTTLADYFILVTGTSTTHIKTLADEVIFQLRERFGLSPHHVEGADDRRWILLDYGDVVTHIFHPEERDYYSLERLWTTTGNYRDQNSGKAEITGYTDLN